MISNHYHLVEHYNQDYLTTFTTITFRQNYTYDTSSYRSFGSRLSSSSASPRTIYAHMLSSDLFLCRRCRDIVTNNNYKSPLTLCALQPRPCCDTNLPMTASKTEWTKRFLRPVRLHSKAALPHRRSTSLTCWHEVGTAAPPAPLTTLWEDRRNLTGHALRHLTAGIIC